MPDERARALVAARCLLLQLSRLPPELDAYGLREQAVRVLRHYPDDGMIQLIARETIWLESP
ncbi:BPSL0761 family protein [Paraburkholderia fungorum]|jgi:hypothetical protein|uniref:BPSL0761 family protein n=1 Tax=Paraburkholderia fungorum TaxID=134537 RepID=UPI000424C476|nr:BPSL0761 family protein [Paraburkholderia fungorum]PZR48473.1 MAG: hypothetical protein DI523_10720 [Paraburkholderia fungorum]